MSNLNKLNGWTGESGYASRTSAQSYLASGTINMTSSGYGSSCGSKDDDAKSTPSSCGTGDSERKPSSCGAGDGEPKPSSCGAGDGEPKPSSCGAGDNNPKPSACGAGEGESKPKTSACGSSCGSGGK